MFVKKVFASSQIEYFSLTSNIKHIGARVSADCTKLQIIEFKENSKIELNAFEDLIVEFSLNLRM